MSHIRLSPKTSPRTHSPSLARHPYTSLPDMCDIDIHKFIKRRMNVHSAVSSYTSLYLCVAHIYLSMCRTYLSIYVSHISIYLCVAHIYLCVAHIRIDPRHRCRGYGRMHIYIYIYHIYIYIYHIYIYIYHMCGRVHIYISIYVAAEYVRHIDTHIPFFPRHRYTRMGWLRLVGPFKL